ncbi:hypothetical protein J2W42_005489 [Rhizobium tibeticum]|uniref:hypothetical protein n=1 Tax=Rhizobium tibeticum TaxID=501024 RepID=UPI00277DC36E|nr:hypothetical protein [Rhizobium tibeticum]MDP9812619.1 hypothetical protein [Rhizobium tibeticum]
MAFKSITLDLESFRSDPSQKSWELPPWGHPIAQGILPLFISYDRHFHPIGTAFTVGDGIKFVVSASHNVMEAFKHEARLRHLLGSKELPVALNLKEVGFHVLHQSMEGKEGGRLTLIPLENVTGAPPTDVIFGYPKFVDGLGTINHKISFDLPPVGEKVWSIGYCDFGGRPIPVSDADDGTFDWMRDYKHRLMVVEGFVRRHFTLQFAAGFVEGPCFMFDSEISHAQSGGPVISTDGTVRGINSSGATNFFNEPASLASLLYPILFKKLNFGVQVGPVRINGSREIVDLIAEGVIRTDGSEERLGIAYDENRGEYFANPAAPLSMQNFVHDDFRGYQDGRAATRGIQDEFRLRKPEE